MSVLYLRVMAVLFALHLGGCAAVRQCSAPAVTAMSANLIGQISGMARSAGFAGAGVLTGALTQLGTALTCIAGQILIGNAEPRAAIVERRSP